jgi:hypothetical protein
MAVSFNSESCDTYLYLGHGTFEHMLSEISDVEDFAYLYVNDIETFCASGVMIDEDNIRYKINAAIDSAREEE